MWQKTAVPLSVSVILDFNRKFSDHIESPYSVFVGATQSGLDARMSVKSNNGQDTITSARI
jgi:hypothetical protein